MKFQLDQEVRVTGHGVGSVHNFNHRYNEYEIKVDGKIIRGIKEHQMIAK